LLCTACSGNQSAVEIELSDGPEISFVDVGGSGASAIKVNDWSFNYYEAGSHAALSHADSPAMARLLVFQGQGWRPDRPGEFQNFYRKLMVESSLRYQGEKRTSNESKAAQMIKTAYYSYMVTGSESEGLRILRQGLPRSWLPFSNKISSDIRKAVINFNPVKSIK